MNMEVKDKWRNKGSFMITDFFGTIRKPVRPPGYVIVIQ